MCDIAKIYCATPEFWLDLLAVLPFELIVFAIETSSAFERWKLVAYFKLNRIFKLSCVRWQILSQSPSDLHIESSDCLFQQIPQEFDHEENFFEGSVLLERMLKLLIYIVLTTHCVACFLFASNTHTTPSDRQYVRSPHTAPRFVHFQLVFLLRCSWIRSYYEGGVARNSSDVYNDYILAVYWATATMTSTGIQNI